MLTIIVESREPASDPFEDRYVDVCTFRTRFWQAEGRALLSFSSPESAAQFWNVRTISRRSPPGTVSTPSTCSAMA
jgi:hypothetical protein